jgi:hypothetical protein
MMNLSERQKTALVAGAIGLAIGAGIGNSLPWYGSPEECMLREAKGIPSDFQYLVRRYCIDKFRAEYAEPSAGPATEPVLAAPEALPAADAMAPDPEPAQ